LEQSPEGLWVELVNSFENTSELFFFPYPSSGLLFIPIEELNNQYNWKPHGIVGKILIVQLFLRFLFYLGHNPNID